MTEKRFIQNSAGQDLYTLIEGPQDAKANVVFVHGNGVDMHGDYFDDIVPVLNRAGYRTVRFDLRGNGKSNGTQEEGNYATYADDIASVLAWLRTSEYREPINLIAHSLGCSVVARLSPEGIVKTVFSGIPNPDTEVRINLQKERMLSYPGGTFDERGVSISINRDGLVRKVGPEYWSEIRKFDAIKSTTEFSKKTKLLLIRPKDDDVVPDIGIDQYASIPGIAFMTLPGNHRFDDPSDRANLIKHVIDFFEK